MNQNVLVVGGAGYIGSHMVVALKEAGLSPIVLDNFSTGHADAVQGVPVVTGNMNDKAILDKVFTQYKIQAVMHFGAFIEVGESVKNPAKYYQNNLAATLILLDTMREHGVKHFIFSSTAAVYGSPVYTPINEAHPVAPINPYGKSKAMVENVLNDYAHAYDFNFVSLRYFNAAGAHPNGGLCERHEPESHLIPLALQVVNGQKEALTIYGSDYDTPDGSCVRDYIHVIDICDAHLKALAYLFSKSGSLICNLGAGRGYSVREVIEAVGRVTGKKVAYQVGARRDGDPAVLLASNEKALTELNWQPQHSDLEVIIKDAWEALADEVTA